MKLPTSDYLEENILCSVSLMQKFGTFLSENAYKQKSGELISLGSAANDLSAVKEFILNKFPENLYCWTIVDFL